LSARDHIILRVVGVHPLGERRAMVDAIPVILAQKQQTKQDGCGRRHVVSSPGAVAAYPLRPVISR
jgi:hypothetical protein